MLTLLRRSLIALALLASFDARAQTAGGDSGEKFDVNTSPYKFSWEKAADEKPQEPAPVSTSCSALQDVLAAADGSFTTLRGDPTKSPAVFRSKVDLPGSKCVVVVGAAADDTTSVLCVARTPAEPTPQSVDLLIASRLQELLTCLDASKWTLTGEHSASQLEQREPNTPKIAVGFDGQKRLLKTTITMTKTPILASQGFCDALGVILRSSSDGYRPLRTAGAGDVDSKVSLPGAARCVVTTQGERPALHCTMSMVDDADAAMQWTHRSVDAVASCLPVDQWKGTPMFGKGTVFEHPDPRASKIRVLKKDYSYQKPEDLKTLGMTVYNVSIDIIGP